VHAVGDISRNLLIDLHARRFRKKTEGDHMNTLVYGLCFLLLTVGGGYVDERAKVAVPQVATST
jgi:hypothetical protein